MNDPHQASRVRFALHGGAGDLAPHAGPLPEHRAALRTIAASALGLLHRGASATDAVEHAVMLLEECPLFNAGVGAVLNEDGVPELDASIMRGRDRACGAVTGIQRSKSPVRLARAAMERSAHVFFHGAGAEQLGRELGLPEVHPSHFITELRLHQLKLAQEHGVIVLDHDTDPRHYPGSEGAHPAFGTVGAVARDAHGGLAAATSTGGLTNKHAGRIGDTPVIGAGTFADDRSLALSCTGTGEAFIKAGFGHHAHGRMLWSHWAIADACADALKAVGDYGGRGGAIAIDHHGGFWLGGSSQALFRAWGSTADDLKVAVLSEEDGA